MDITYLKKGDKHPGCILPQSCTPRGSPSVGRLPFLSATFLGHAQGLCRCGLRWATCGPHWWMLVVHDVGWLIYPSLITMNNNYLRNNH